MLYIILEKDLSDDRVSVHSAFDDEETAVYEMERLIESTENFGYKMVAQEQTSVQDDV